MLMNICCTVYLLHVSQMSVTSLSVLLCQADNLMSVVSQESSESANTTIEDEDVRGRKVQTGSRAA